MTSSEADHIDISTTLKAEDDTLQVPIKKNEENVTSFLQSDSHSDTEDISYLSAQDLERVKEECRTNKHVKPPYSYIALITMAVLQVEQLYLHFLLL